jgi:NO-binding membrane sensor protein with MHYT domain
MYYCTEHAGFFVWALHEVGALATEQHRISIVFDAIISLCGPISNLPCVLQAFRTRS